MRLGPCANKTESTARVTELVKFIFMPPISEPSANKYTKTDPCVRSVCLVTSTFGVLRKAISRMLWKVEESTGPADVVEPDGAIGVARDTYAYEKKLGHLKVQKVHTFLRNAAAKHLLMVWVVVTQPIMVLHYFLFKHGKFYNHRTGDEDAVTVFDFVDDTNFNRLSSTMAALSSMLMEANGHAGQRHLRLLGIQLGPLEEWPTRVKVALQVSLLLGLAVLWRKLAVHFESYPWALAPAFSSNRSWAQREATLQAFFFARARAA